jgi:molybdate transport system ATP-binding protein
MIQPNALGADRRAVLAGSERSAVESGANEGLRLVGSAVVGALVIDVDLQVPPGETLAVLGPNGAGKSTLLRVIAGLQPLTGGSLSLDGRVLDDPSAGVLVPPEDRAIGVVFQDLLLFPHLDSLANVAFGLEVQGRSRAEARRAAAEWLERMEVADRSHAHHDELSGGEAQRVALARALAPGPRALLLDEPLSALDAEIRPEVRRTLRDHLAGQSGPRLLVTHDLLDAAILADRLVVMEEGRITDSGTLTELVARPRSAWSAELAGTNLLPAVATGTRCDLVGGGAIVVAHAPGDGPVLVAIRPAAVALHREHPEGSARNVWAATVAEVEGYAERVRVRLEGGVPLVAEVTAAAVADLEIHRGRELWASAKATDVTAYPR